MPENSYWEIWVNDLRLCRTWSTNDKNRLMRLYEKWYHPWTPRAILITDDDGKDYE